MTTSVKFDLSDYMKIAKIIFDKAFEEPAIYDIEYKFDGGTLYLSVDYDFDTCQDISYNYGDHEPLVEICNEHYDTYEWCVLGTDGEYLKNDFDTERLLQILN